MMLCPQDRLLRADQGFGQICAILEMADRLRACGCAASLCFDYVKNNCLCCCRRHNSFRCRLAGAQKVLRFFVTAQVEPILADHSQLAQLESLALAAYETRVRQGSSKPVVCPPGPCWMRFCVGSPLSKNFLCGQVIIF